MTKQSNPAIYFEIPVKDIKRAILFYQSVFHFEFNQDKIDGYQMALFPFYEKEQGITGALAKGDVYKPSTDGVLIYFGSEDIEHTLDLALSNGGQILYPKTDNGLGFVAEILDTEGNRIAIFQSYTPQAS